MSESNGNGRSRPSLWSRVVGLFQERDSETSLRAALEEILEESGAEEEDGPPISEDERVMLANLLKFRHLTAYDVMVPRADIVAIPEDITLEKFVEVIAQAGHSRLPVIRDSLDEVVGMVHIKDSIPLLRGKAPFKLSNIMRKVLFVSPSMRLLDLLLEMRRSRIHLALVVDEFGGIDGLISIEDLVEEIVGDIEDEHDVAEGPKLLMTSDGTILADARATIEEFEETVGPILTEEEREEDIDTLGGLVFHLADRIPDRGELVTHEDSGITFEVVQGDPRRIKRLRVRNLPQRAVLPDHG